MSVVITESKLFFPLRRRLSRPVDTNPKFLTKIRTQLAEIAGCSMCSGFWVGLFLGAVWISPTENIFLDGIVGSTIPWILDNLRPFNAKGCG
tara:strand:- start:400 stop:675 length:276 start_codon:yes stop_codon:yes gene_type:complete